MEITFASTPSDKPNDTILSIRADVNEKISVGDYIDIELTNGDYVKKKIESMEYWDRKETAKRGKWIKIDAIENGQSCEAYICGIQSNTIQTTSMPSRRIREKWANMICITPFKEIKGGTESIYDYVEEGYTVPEKVIAYLRTTKPFLLSPGIYEHPFKKDIQLLGPYLYTDDRYYWDRDTWEYVVKYHVRLPEDFINHVMSIEGTAFIEKQIDASC